MRPNGCSGDELAGAPGDPRASFNLGLVIAVARGHDQAADGLLAAWRGKSVRTPTRRLQPKLAALTELATATGCRDRLREGACAPCADDAPWPDLLLDPLMEQRQVGHRSTREPPQVAELENAHLYQEAADLYASITWPTSRTRRPGLRWGRPQPGPPERLRPCPATCCVRRCGSTPTVPTLHFTLALVQFTRGGKGNHSASPDSEAAGKGLAAARRLNTRAHGARLKPDFTRRPIRFWGVAQK